VESSPVQCKRSVVLLHHDGVSLKMDKKWRILCGGEAAGEKMNGDRCGPSNII
jgi:hypothetical protein